MNGVKWSKVCSTQKIEKIIIVGTGPSLKNFDFNKLDGKGFIIAVNDSGKDVLNANIWFTLDPWGLQGPQLPPRNFKGQLWAAVPEDFGTINARCDAHKITASKTINFLHRIPFHTTNANTQDEYLNWGLNEDNSCINTLNSGYGALNFAYHLKPKKILLLGMDATSGYYYDPIRKTKSLHTLPWIFESAKKQLDVNGIKILNGSIDSNITCFSKFSIDNALYEFCR